MTENKTARYLKYAIGEIILVVIGILIALQINNWNEKRNHEKAEQDFFKGIAYDLNQDLEFIKFVKKSTKPKMDAYVELSTHFPKNYALHHDKIGSLLGIYLFSGQRTFYPISGSFKSALAGNEINTYSQKKRIQQIIKLYGSYDRLIDNGNILDERWSTISEKYSHNRRLNSFDNLSEQGYITMLDELYFHYIQLEWYNNILTDTETEIQNLIQELE